MSEQYQCRHCSLKITEKMFLQHVVCTPRACFIPIRETLQTCGLLWSGAERKIEKNNGGRAVIRVV